MSVRLLWAVAALAVLVFAADRYLQMRSNLPAWAKRSAERDQRAAESALRDTAPGLRPADPGADQRIAVIPPPSTLDDGNRQEPDRDLVRRAARGDTGALEKLGVHFWVRERYDQALPNLFLAALGGSAQAHALLAENGFRQGSRDGLIEGVAFYLVAVRLDAQFDSLRNQRMADRLSADESAEAQEMAGKMIGALCEAVPSKLNAEACR
ncbi:MAG: hypothetical protein KJN93_00435 [Alphaproteobacteria bacterium]|nr:hypothetical protein [Alphaproteobacteria bacterium]NNF24324.1 hypothetical protein [Paracoccaceae bacterium]